MGRQELAPTDWAAAPVAPERSLDPAYVILELPDPQQDAAILSDNQGGVATHEVTTDNKDGTVQTEAKQEDLEIERRWQVGARRLPELRVQAEGVEDIIQGYLYDAEGVRHRIRQTRHADGTFTYECNFKRQKGGSRLVRAEPKQKIDQTTFLEFWPRVTVWLSKTRYIIPFGSRSIHLDNFGDQNFMIAEIEYDTEEEAMDENQEFPEWFDDEVTEDGRWGSYSIATKGMPTPQELAEQPKPEKSRKHKKDSKKKHKRK